LELFPVKKILGRLLYEASIFSSNACNTYTSYVHQKLTLLRNLRANWSTPDLIELIVHGIQESKVRDAVVANNFETISDLIAYLNSAPKPTPASIAVASDESATSNTTKMSMSRPRERSDPFYKPTRHRCGHIGHIQRNCKNFKHQNIPQKQTSFPSSSHPVKTEFKSPSNNVSSELLTGSRTNSGPNKCSFCLKTGHNVDNCFTKSSIEKRRNVNAVVSNDGTIPTKIKIDNETYVGIFDSGADISLVSEKFIHKFSSKIVPHKLRLKGIAGNVLSEYEFEADVEISGQHTKLKFAVVPSACLDYDVILGCNLFDDVTLAAVTDRSGTCVIRKQLPGILRVKHDVSDFKLNVPDERFDKVNSLLQKYSALLAPGRSVNNAFLKINLKDDFIVSRSPYRFSISEREEIRKIILELLDAGIIRESSSPYASPVLLVRKKEGTYRMCVDFRELNAHTVKDRYPLPRIDDQLDRLGRGNFFTSLDMASGFHQIPVDSESVHKTAFVTPDGHFEYLRMPFGLANAPAIFQRSINDSLGKLKYTIAIVYVDDVLIPSETVEQGILHLEQVLQALLAAGFTLNLTKCSFLKSKIEYLGREISCEGIQPGKRKVEALKRVTSPTNVKQVRQFMGLAGYFRKFIKDFATRTACITKLTKNNVAFNWTKEHEDAKSYVVSCLVSQPLLVVFDPNLPTELHTDASSIGYGGILFQKYDGQNKVVGYFSKRTTDTEAKYHSYELETLAIVNSLKHFRVYLIGIKFKIVTDCNSVKATVNKREIVPRIARWWIYMQDFDYEINYRKGSSLNHVDYLSRNPVSVLRVSRNRGRDDSWLYIEQKGNAEVRQMLSDLHEGKLDGNQYVEKDGLLCHRHKTKNGNEVIRYFVPRHSRLGLLRLFHDEQCHVGIDKVTSSILSHFWFPKLRNFVKNYIKHCLVCAVKKTRSGPLQGRIQLPEKVPVPIHTIHIDCLGPLPVTSDKYKYVLVTVDAFTKYCHLTPLKTVTAAETQKALQLFISCFGTPRVVVMDRGTNFHNLSVCKFFDEWGIQYHYVTPDVHRANGQVERYMRTIMNLIRIETRVRSEWPNVLWKIQLVLNTTIHKSTKMTPLQILIGIDSSTPLIQAALNDLTPDLSPVRNMKLDRQRVAERLKPNVNDENKLNQKRRDNARYVVGNFVLLHRASKLHASKSDFEYMGPYEIVNITEEGRYDLRKLGPGRKTIVKAAKEQLRVWPVDWSLGTDLEDLLITLDSADESCDLLFVDKRLLEGKVCPVE
jgi:hypothetical protein